MVLENEEARAEFVDCRNPAQIDASTVVEHNPFFKRSDAMHVSMVMMLALAGLGCENMPIGASEPAALPVYQADSPTLPSTQESGYPTAGYSNAFPSIPYPEIPSRLYTFNPPPHSGDWHAEVRSTLWSFVLGHDPDVSNVREIEASVYGVEYGH